MCNAAKFGAVPFNVKEHLKAYHIRRADERQVICFILGINYNKSPLYLPIACKNWKWHHTSVSKIWGKN
jgi:hypothetical protein